MALFHCNFYSKYLGYNTQVNVILPENRDPYLFDEDRDYYFQTIYLLHGLGDDCNGWMRKTSIERYALEHQLAVIMPSGEDIFLAGLSMGGYGALKIGSLVAAVSLILMFFTSNSTVILFLIAAWSVGFGLRQSLLFAAFPDIVLSTKIAFIGVPIVTNVLAFHVLVPYKLDKIYPEVRAELDRRHAAL